MPNHNEIRGTITSKRENTDSGIKKEINSTSYLRRYQRNLLLLLTESFDHSQNYKIVSVLSMALFTLVCCTTQRLPHLQHTINFKILVYHLQ